MLKRAQIIIKRLEIKQSIRKAEALGTEAAEEYIEHLKRLDAAYLKEYDKAPAQLSLMERWHKNG